MNHNQMVSPFLSLALRQKVMAYLSFELVQIIPLLRWGRGGRIPHTSPQGFQARNWGPRGSSRDPFFLSWSLPNSQGNSTFLGLLVHRIDTEDRPCRHSEGFRKLYKSTVKQRVTMSKLTSACLTGWVVDSLISTLTKPLQ